MFAIHNKNRCEINKKHQLASSCIKYIVSENHDTLDLTSLYNNGIEYVLLLSRGGCHTCNNEWLEFINSNSKYSGRLGARLPLVCNEGFIAEASVNYYIKEQKATHFLKFTV